jgi:hypothetical protein
MNPSSCFDGTPPSGQQFRIGGKNHAATAPQHGTCQAILGGGRPIRADDPTLEQVVAWALAPDDSVGHG